MVLAGDIRCKNLDNTASSTFQLIIWLRYFKWCPTSAHLKKLLCLQDRGIEFYYYLSSHGVNASPGHRIKIHNHFCRNCGYIRSQLSRNETLNKPRKNYLLPSNSWFQLILSALFVHVAANITTCKPALPGRENPGLFRTNFNGKAPVGVQQDQ